MLFDTIEPALGVSLSTLITVVVVTGVLMGVVIWLVVRAHKGRVAVGHEGLIGKTATARSATMVYVDGALWKIECDAELAAGDKVEIVAVEALTLKVKKL